MKLLFTLLLLPFLLSHDGNGVLWAGDWPASPGLKKTRLHVVASEAMFATVNPRDAIASMSIWIKQLGAIRGFDCDYKIETALSLGQIRQKLKEHLVDFDGVGHRGCSGVNGTAGRGNGRKGAPLDVARD